MSGLCFCLACTHCGNRRSGAVVSISVTPESQEQNPPEYNVKENTLLIIAEFRCPPRSQIKYQPTDKSLQLYIYNSYNLMKKMTDPSFFILTQNTRTWQKLQTQRNKWATGGKAANNFRGLLTSCLTQCTYSVGGRGKTNVNSIIIHSLPKNSNSFTDEQLLRQMRGKPNKKMSPYQVVLLT